jgi:hypothetical protein
VKILIINLKIYYYENRNSHSSTEQL